MCTDCFVVFVFWFMFRQLISAGERGRPAVQVLRADSRLCAGFLQNHGRPAADDPFCPEQRSAQPSDCDELYQVSDYLKSKTMQIGRENVLYKMDDCQAKDKK